MLTDKCKVDFETWFFTTHETYVDYLGKDWFGERFLNLPQSMQYGVYVDFFDSVGIRGYIDEVGQLECIVKFSLYDGDVINGTVGLENRNDARAELIEKANEIYNEKN